MAGDVIDFFATHLGGPNITQLYLTDMLGPSVIDNFIGDHNDLTDRLCAATINMIVSSNPENFHQCPQAFRLILAGHYLWAVHNEPLREYANG